MADIKEKGFGIPEKFPKSRRALRRTKLSEPRGTYYPRPGGKTELMLSWDEEDDSPSDIEKSKTKNRAKKQSLSGERVRNR